MCRNYKEYNMFYIFLAAMSIEKTLGNNHKLLSLKCSYIDILNNYIK